jgi:hypothetical protein
MVQEFCMSSETVQNLHFNALQTQRSAASGCLVLAATMHSLQFTRGQLENNPTKNGGVLISHSS